MTTGIAGSSKLPHVPGLPAGVPDAVAGELTANVAAEDQLAKDALRQLGYPLPARQHPPLRQDFMDEVALDAQPGRRPVHVPVGTQVTTGRGVDWYVVGTSSDQVHLARRAADDSKVLTTSRTWASLVERNLELLDGPLIDARGVGWVPFATEGVDQLGQLAPVGLVPIDNPSAAQIPTTWGDVLRGTELARRRPIAVAPRTELDVAQLRDVIGDRQFVVSRAGEPYGLRGALIGTDTAPSRAAQVLEDANAMQDWFHHKVGIDVWSPRQQALLFTDSHDHLANAAAAAFGDEALVWEGPRSERVRGSWLTELGGDEGQFTRRISKMIDEHDVGVRTHEAGHVAVIREWGQLEDRVVASTPVAAVLEEHVVQEAFPDLLGAARAGQPTVGVRELGRLANGWGDLEQFRTLIATTPPEHFDVHLGTQLLTRPMVRVQQELGDDMLAEITGAAIRDIGRQIKGGSVTTVDLPMAAKALRDATAWRQGAESGIVQYLDEAWRMLGVLR